MNIRLFDIVALAFTTGTESGREGLDRLAQRFPQSTQPVWGEKHKPLFRSVDSTTAAEILKVLDSLGIRTEIRPAVAAEPVVQASVTVEPRGIPCPSCSFENPETFAECGACGLVFAKHEQRAVRQMMRTSKLEQELNKAQKIQQEWDERASKYRQDHSFPANATEEFSKALLTEEIPFLRLQTDSGPILLTSRRILISSKGPIFSIPFEMIAGVELGGGFTILGGSVRMILTFKAPLLLGKSRTTSLSRQIRKTPSYDRETILHWVFSKNFICNGCGSRDLSYRFENRGTRARCMRCASDHLIDLTHAIAQPTGETSP